MCGNIHVYACISLARVDLLQARTFLITTPPFISEKSLLPDLLRIFRIEEWTSADIMMLVPNLRQQ